MTWDQIWNFIFLFVHLATFIGFVVLYRLAPCWMQKLVVAGQILAFGTMSIAFTLAVFGVWGWWYFAILGLAIEHLAVLMYLFRLIYQSIICQPKSSVPSHSS